MRGSSGIQSLLTRVAFLMSNNGLAATLWDGASNWTAILASLTTASNYGFVRYFAVVWLYLGTILWYGCITSSHFSWEHCGGPSSKSVFVFYHDAFEVDVYSTRRLPLFRIAAGGPTSGRGLLSLFLHARPLLCGSLSGCFQLPGRPDVLSRARSTPSLAFATHMSSSLNVPCTVTQSTGASGRVFPDATEYQFDFSASKARTATLHQPVQISDRALALSEVVWSRGIVYGVARSD